MHFFARAMRSKVVSNALLMVAATTALAGAISADANAQPLGVGPLVLRLAASARLLGMANAGITGNDGDALFYNPAMLNNARGMAVSMQRFGSAATSGSLASVSQIGTMSIGVGVQFLDWSATSQSYGTALHEGASHLSDGGSIPSSSTAITLGLVRAYHGHRLGLSAKYVEDRLGAQHDGTIAFDAGVMLPSFGFGQLSFVAQNLGEGLRIGGEKGSLPTRVGIGYGGGMYSAFEKFDFGLQTQLTVERGRFVRPAGGAELGYVPIEGVAIIVRAGLRLPKEKDESLATGGLGVTVDRISIDYAIEPFRGGRPVSHRLGLRIR